jgi:hypothetical protein
VSASRDRISTKCLAPSMALSTCGRMSPTAMLFRSRQDPYPAGRRRKGRNNLPR